MASLMNSLFGTSQQLDDQTIANQLLMGAKGACGQYLTATLESATPELRTMLSNNLNQVLGGHSALTALAVNKDWYKPYEKPDEQLIATFKNSQTAINPQ